MLRAVSAGGDVREVTMWWVNCELCEWRTWLAWFDDDDEGRLRAIAEALQAHLRWQHATTMSLDDVQSIMSVSTGLDGTEPG